MLDSEKDSCSGDNIRQLCPIDVLELCGHIGLVDFLTGANVKVNNDSSMMHVVTATVADTSLTVIYGLSTLDSHRCGLMSRRGGFPRGWNAIFSS